MDRVEVMTSRVVRVRVLASDMDYSTEDTSLGIFCHFIVLRGSK